MDPSSFGCLSAALRANQFKPNYYGWQHLGVYGCHYHRIGWAPFADVAGSASGKHSFADRRNVIRRPAASASPWTPFTVIMAATTLHSALPLVAAALLAILAETAAIPTTVHTGHVSLTPEAAKDQIHDLPGIPEGVTFRQFSGGPPLRTRPRYMLASCSVKRAASRGGSRISLIALPADRPR